MKTESTKQDVAILVVSCDAYQDLWYPFFHCFFKYWPDCPYPIYLGSNLLLYPEHKVQPILVGPDVDYTTNLIYMLNHIDQQWVILWIEDRILSAPVDMPRLTKLIQSAQSQQAGYLKLIASHPFAIAKNETREIGEIPKGKKYRVCMTVALWNKQVLLKLLRPGETAWEIERCGSQRSDRLNEKFFSLSFAIRKDPPLNDVHLIIKGRLLRDAVKFLKREGLQDRLNNRPLQSLTSYCYVKAYIAALDLHCQLQWRWWHSRLY